MARASKNPAHRTPAGVLLSRFAARGPLFADVRLAVCRAAALGVASELALGADSFDAGVQAAATLGAHTRPVEAAKYRASRREWATARSLLTDIERAAREVPSGVRLRLALLDILYKRAAVKDVDEWVFCLGLATQLAGALCSSDERLRARCARTLLSWTRLAWRKVGYSEREEGEKNPSPSRPRSRSASDSRTRDGEDASVPSPAPQAHAAAPP